MLEDVTANKKKMKELEDNLLVRLTSTQVCGHATPSTSLLIVCKQNTYIMHKTIIVVSPKKRLHKMHQNVCLCLLQDYRRFYRDVLPVL